MVEISASDTSNIVGTDEMIRRFVSETIGRNSVFKRALRFHPIPVSNDFVHVSPSSVHKVHRCYVAILNLRFITRKKIL